MFFKNGLCRSAVVAAVSLSTLAASSPSPIKHVKGNSQTQTTGDACFDAATYWENGEPSIPAETAYNCMTSVPFDSKRSLFVLDQIRKFSQIYSAQAFFVEPPTLELRIKPVDLNGTFSEIEKKASAADGYANDYEFNLQMMSLFESYHDGHVFYRPNCALQFKFYHDYPLVALLKEGSDIPGIYLADPLTGKVGEEVAEINGEEAHKHLERLAAELPGLPWIDADARWNELLMSKHPIDGLYRGAFAWRDFWFEKSFPMKFKNGESVDVEWKAYFVQKPTYTNAQEYFMSVCLDPAYVDSPQEPPTSTKNPKEPQPTKTTDHEPPKVTEVVTETEVPDTTETETDEEEETPYDDKETPYDDKETPYDDKEPELPVEEEYTDEYTDDDDADDYYDDEDDYYGDEGGYEDDDYYGDDWQEPDLAAYRHHSPPGAYRRQKRDLDRAIHRRFNRDMKKRSDRPLAVEAIHHSKGLHHSPSKGDESQEEPPATSADEEPAPLWPDVALKMSGSEQTLYDLDETTVLWGIHAFADSAQDPTFPERWVEFLVEMVTYCKKNKKTHVLIDVSGNGGGYVSLGLETIRHLFPDAHPFYGFDLRRSPALDLLIEKSGYATQSHLDLNNTKTLDGKDFASIEDYLGPVFKFNDYFTKEARFDVESQVDELALPPVEITEAPFLVENMVLISDGRCGSTCAIFGEAISNIGIKSIAINGVADEKMGDKYMQHVGGIKGSQVWSWDAFMDGHVVPFVENPEQYDFLPKRLPILHQTNMNLRNSYQPGSNIPLEFTWQPANSHLYTTQAMWNDKVELWKACADKAWDQDGKNILKDVPEGTTNKFATEGGWQTGKGKGVGNGPGSQQQVIGGADEGWSYYILWWFEGIKNELPKVNL